MSAEPTSIGNYRIISRLGGGGMATVYRAMQTGLQRVVALKIMAPQFADDPHFCDRFLREAQAGALISHPNVITCYDAGKIDGKLYLALELVTGGDLDQLTITRGGQIDETLALNLIRDAAAGLEAIEGAGLVHRDIKPANIFVSDKGVAKLADLGLVHFSDESTGGKSNVTNPGTIMGTPAYIAPEQARGIKDIDIRADIYSLGASLFHLLTGGPPYNGDSPLATLVSVLNDPFPDPLSLRPDLSASVCSIILKSCEKDRSLRYSCARHMREDLVCALEGNPLRHAKVKTKTGQHDAAPASKSPPHSPIPKSPAPRSQVPSPPPAPAPTPVPTTSKTRIDVSPTPGTDKLTQSSTPTPPAQSPGGNSKIDLVQLKQLTKRIVVDKQSLTASLALAPGASFPRFLLDQVLEAAGIVYGLIQGSINDAARPSQTPRRIVLARGSPPSPGIAGKGVRGEKLAPVDAAIMIVVAEDGLSAAALTRMGELVTKEDIEPVLKASQIRFGLNIAALHQLVDGPASPNGRLVIARGRAPVPANPGGFNLSENVENTSIDTLGGCDLKRVNTGATLGSWTEASDGIPGMDVLGRPLPAAKVKNLRPEDCIGEGTEIGRDGMGMLVLRATRNGLCQRQLSGSVRVVGAVEIVGNLTADSPPIDTTDIVIIRGNVEAGARISSSSDVVILGDLSDAHISTGGSLQVQGSIGPGQSPLIAGETITAENISVRRVMAGNLKISGTVSHCELLSSGDITCERVIGGSVTAGGNLTVNTVGDSDGTSTELWAGHNLSYKDQSELVRLAEKRHDAERDRLVSECKTIEADLNDSERKNVMLQNSRYVKSEVAAQMKDRLDLLRQNQQAAAQASETARKELARLRGLTEELKNLGDNANAKIQVAVVAHAGTVLRLANMEPEILNAPRLKMKLGK